MQKITILIFCLLAAQLHGQVDNLNASYLTLEDWETLEEWEKGLLLDGVISAMAATSVYLVGNFAQADPAHMSGLSEAGFLIDKILEDPNLMDKVGMAIDLMAEDPEWSGVNLSGALAYALDILY
jgi:hypothetical protein